MKKILKYSFIFKRHYLILIPLLFSINSFAQLTGALSANNSPTVEIVPGTIIDFHGDYPGSEVITQWSWDFGDGGTAFGQNCTHVYTAPGNYHVRLWVFSYINGIMLDGDTIIRGILVEPILPINLQDSLALVDLYNHTNGSNWLRQGSWLAAQPVSNWDGITTLFGRVKEIYLPNNRMIGSIPSSIGNLSQLQTLYLDNNFLSGTVPNTLTNIPNLYTKRLANNKFTFDGLEQIAQVLDFTNPAISSYWPQANIPVTKAGNVLSVSAGGTLSNNTYKWYKKNSQDPVVIIGDSTFVPSTPGIYSVKITNSIATQLILYSDSVLITSPFITLCPPMGSSTQIANITGTTYRWQLNNGFGFNNIFDNINYTGTNTTELHINNIPSTYSGYQYRCVADASKTGLFFTLQFLNSWQGSTNSLWETASNWSCGSIPDANTDVVINSGNVVLNSKVTVRSLAVMPGATFTVNNGFALTIRH